MSKTSAGVLAVLGGGLAAIGAFLLIVAHRLVMVRDPQGRDFMAPYFADLLTVPGVVALVLGSLMSVPWFRSRGRRDK